MSNPQDIIEEEKSEFVVWFETFLEEKGLGYIMWDVEGLDGTIHMIDSDVVIESIKNCHPSEQRKIKDIIVKIDFHNGDVLHFFNHLATGLVANYGRS